MDKIILSIIEKDRKFENDDYLSRKPEWRGMKCKTKNGEITTHTFMQLNWVNVQGHFGGEKLKALPSHSHSIKHL